MIKIHSFDLNNNNIYVGTLYLESEKELSKYNPDTYTYLEPLEDKNNKTLHFIKDKWEYRDIPKIIESYREKRKKAYPNLTTQLDMLWHDINNGRLNIEESTFFNTIKAIKEEYPKDNIEYDMN